MNKLTIHTKVFLVTLLPLSVTAVLLSSYFIYGKIADIDQALDAKGQAVAHLLSPASEYGVLSGNTESLTKLIYASARDRDIASITVSDARGRVIAHTSPEGGVAPNSIIPARSDPLFRAYNAPIYYTSLVVDDFERGTAPGSDASGLIGNIRVVVTREHAIAQQGEVLVNGLLITTIALLITAWLAALMARSVTSPIRKLTEVAKSIRDGDLKQRVDNHSSGELGILEEAINTMAQSLDRARERERKLAEDELFIEKVKAQTTLESLGEGVITTDANGAVTYLNPAAEKLTGWSFADAGDRQLHEVFNLISSNTRVAVRYPVEQCISEGSTIHHDLVLTLIRHDGKEFIIQDTATPIRDSNDTVVGMVLVFHDYSKLHRMSERLAYQAAHDDLTGLLNRREFEAQLAKALTEVNNQETEHALCYIDLDQFKIVNDSCGHNAGDELLRQLTHQIHDKIRRHDIFARLGGDEFGIILKDCSLASAEKLAYLIKDTVNAFRFTWQRHTFEIGASIGLVPITDSHVTTSELMMTADSACYIAKDKGRNRIHIYEPTDADVIQRSTDMQWLQKLNQSLESNRFVLYSQLITPIKEEPQLADHYEILIRLQDPEKGLIPPQLFIPAAERYQLMLSVDQWVIKTVFAMLREAGFTRSAGASTCTGFSINLSAQSITDGALLDFILEQFRDTDVNPQVITFEITETAAIANLARAINFIEKLKELGCRFSLDDFGSGLSSFGYLSSLPVDCIKIDGRFVSDIVKNPVSRSIVESIAHIGRVMGLQTIAEFVESDDILREARDCGIDFAQGYGIEHPRPFADALEDLESGETGKVAS
ncbi:MAG: EAL domain-containing protein [Thiogranum sp.]|nr:EAL domain-containing protein [Thiogranum sp.]